MALEFAVYQRQTTASTLTDNGTVRELMQSAGNEGSLGYIPSNFKRETKVNAQGETVYNRVQLLVFNGEIDSETGKPLSLSINCSESVSRALRAKTLTLSQVADYSILENEQGISFVSEPGAGVVVVDGSKLKAVAQKSKAVSHEDCIAL
jgi:hypothetical protein